MTRPRIETESEYRSPAGDPSGCKRSPCPYCQQMAADLRNAESESRQHLLARNTAILARNAAITRLQSVCGPEMQRLVAAAMVKIPDLAQLHTAMRAAMGDC